MNRGVLADYFTGVAAKLLSAVEANPVKSNQHEFNGVSDLISVLGTPPSQQKFPTRFIYLADTVDYPLIEDAFLTWYDARRNHPYRSEWRLYFPKTSVSDSAQEGDVLLIGRRQDETLLAIIAKRDSTIANQILWLFDISTLNEPTFSVRAELEADQRRLGFTSRLILESLGVEVDVVEVDYLARMRERFGDKFPRTRVFSDFARSIVGPVDVLADPDGALMAWMDKEEILFRTFEKYLLANRLADGFQDDVDGFLSFSLSIQNRRKSRVGLAFENHIEEVFRTLSIRFCRGCETEPNVKPDFLFPGREEYHDSTFDAEKLTMLGVKSTCKDRWRQVLSEGQRLHRKHLLTLEASISLNQVNEMKTHDLQLVVPRSLHESYLPVQRNWLLDLATFCQLVVERQQWSHD